jgi:lipopolysaccharide transport system ATP-binding protein
MSAVIKVENLSKQYRLGQVGTGTISHDVNRWWHKIRGKEDPYLKIGESNDRTVKGESDYVWALKDINFEVQQGEVLGIIGRNGAGKSTLLKILSRTTAPTTGSVKIKGRVASLLEVGTGFHPELSGRDNIFLNGAILGMTRREIQSKFDEIVDFAGVERYIDTPVKRYSSGMYVRLAFAVAAHLEPEILIIDEVLAVGDAEFQKKCLGKMKDVSVNQGRTILFVSHNIPALKNLSNQGLYLKHGSEADKGLFDKIIEKYQLDNFQTLITGNRKPSDLFEKFYIYDWFIDKCGAYIENERNAIISSKEICLVVNFISKVDVARGEFGLVIRNVDGIMIYSINSRDYNKEYISIKPGTYSITFKFELPIKNGTYQLDFALIENNMILDQWISESRLKVISDFQNINPENWIGIVNSKFEYTLTNL